MIYLPSPFDEYEPVPTETAASRQAHRTVQMTSAEVSASKTRSIGPGLTLLRGAAPLDTVDLSVDLMAQAVDLYWKPMDDALRAYWGPLDRAYRALGEVWPR